MVKFVYIPNIENENEFGELVELLKSKNENINDFHFLIDDDSEKNFNRIQYGMLKWMLRKGDKLYIKSPDSLGYNRKMILDEWEEITEQIQADIISLDGTTLNRNHIGAHMYHFIPEILTHFVDSRNPKQ